MNKVAFAFGRLNPPTRGHQLLVTKISEQDAEPRLYLSHSCDPEMNPLSYEKKLYWCEQSFGDMVNVIETASNTMYQIMHDLYEEGVTDVIYFCGSDRVADAEKMKTYNGNPDKKGNIVFQFDSMEIVKVGEDRINEDDIPVEKVSASLMREFARENDLDSFIPCCPEALDEDQCAELFNDVREGMGLTEELEEEFLDEETIIHREDQYINMENCKNFIDYINSSSAHTKRDLIYDCKNIFGLVQEVKSIYGTEDFSVRFTENGKATTLENQSSSYIKPGTVTGIKRIVSRNTKPFFIVCTYPLLNRSVVWLGNLAYIDRVSHTSAKHLYFDINYPEKTNLSGSIQGHDLMSPLITSSNFEQMWEDQTNLDYNNKLSMISMATQKSFQQRANKNISKRYNTTYQLETNLRQNISNSVSYCNSDDFIQLKKTLDSGAEVASKYIPQLVGINKNLMSNLVEAIIKDPQNAEKYINNPSIVSNSHDIADFVYGNALVDIKFSINGQDIEESITKGGGVKLIDIESLIKIIDLNPEKIMLLYLFKTNTSGQYRTSLLSVYDTENIKRYRVTDLWSGPGFRGHLAGRIHIHDNSINSDFAYNEFSELFSSLQ